MMKCTDPSIVLTYLGYPFPTMHLAGTSSCSKSFGETTPSGRPCKAHRSPNVLAQGPQKVAQGTLPGDTGHSLAGEHPNCVVDGG